MTVSFDGKAFSVPAYALTIHKARLRNLNARPLDGIIFSCCFVVQTQALSIKHTVNGCLEGVFAFGQVYVLVSRCTDGANFNLIGVPPIDLIADVAAALKRAGLDADTVFRTATSVSQEWDYDAVAPVNNRFHQKRREERTVPMRHKTLVETLSMP